jgi:hypothetical protein
MDKLSDVYVAEADSEENKELYQTCVEFLNEEKGWSVVKQFQKIPSNSPLALDQKKAWTENINVTQKIQDISGFFLVFRRTISKIGWDISEAVEFKYVPTALKDSLRKLLENEKIQDPRVKASDRSSFSKNNLCLGRYWGDRFESLYYILKN